MKQYKKIYCCGDCIYYSWKKHRCTRGASEEGKAQDPFYTDCPLPGGEEPKDDGVFIGRWIPVSERLPVVGVRYQVTFESGEVGYADFKNKIFLGDGSAKENVWEIEQYYEDDGQVIAWMELPEPYKEVEENK